MMKTFFSLLLLMFLAWPAASHAADTPSFAETRAKAEQGDAVAQYNLGQMYYKGQGVTRNYAEAAKWFRKAAEQGLAEAQYNLGVMYREGEGVTRDYAEAAKLTRKAAEQEIAVAQYSLGLMYAKGQGVTRDYETAYIWLARAAAQGDENASKTLNIVEKTLTPEQLARAQKAASQPLNPTPKDPSP
jgi:TPR repeat protein